MTTDTALTDAAKEAVDEAIATALGDAYDCTRTWSAWSYGTMGPDDFSLVAEDSDRLREITDAAIQAVLQSPEVKALRKDAERYREVRRMSLREFSDIYMANLKTGAPFDRLVDAAMEKQP